MNAVETIYATNNVLQSSQVLLSLALFASVFCNAILIGIVRKHVFKAP